MKLYAKIADTQNAIQVNGHSRAVRVVFDVIAFDEGSVEGLRALIGGIPFFIEINEEDDGEFIPIDDRSGERANSSNAG